MAPTQKVKDGEKRGQGDHVRQQLIVHCAAPQLRRAWVITIIKAPERLQVCKRQVKGLLMIVIAMIVRDVG